MIVLSNLGLGDHIICNGLYRWFAQREDVLIVPCYEHNRVSVCALLADVPNIQVVGFENEREVLNGVQSLQDALGQAVLRLGWYGKGFDRTKWDSEFYRQAGLPFDFRWEFFDVPAWLHDPVAVPKGTFCLIHHDPERGLVIPEDRLPLMDRIYVRPTGPITNWFPCIQAASQLHVIDSSILCLADSQPLPWGQRRAVHRYVRPTTPPVLRNFWEVLEK